MAPFRWRQERSHGDESCKPEDHRDHFNCRDHITVCEAGEPYRSEGQVGHCDKGGPATEEEEVVDGV